MCCFCWCRCRCKSGSQTNQLGIEATLLPGCALSGRHKQHQLTSVFLLWVRVEAHFASPAQYPQCSEMRSLCVVGALAKSSLENATSACDKGLHPRGLFFLVEQIVGDHEASVGMWGSWLCWTGFGYNEELALSWLVTYIHSSVSRGQSLSQANLPTESCAWKRGCQAMHLRTFHEPINHSTWGQVPATHIKGDSMGTEDVD